MSYISRIHSFILLYPSSRKLGIVSINGFLKCKIAFEDLLQSKQFSQLQRLNDRTVCLNSKILLSLKYENVYFSRSIEESLPNVEGVAEGKPPPPSPHPLQKEKKTKPPKIDFTLVHELQKLDNDFELKKSAFQAIFPFPKNNLHNAFSVITSQLGTKQKAEWTYQRLSEAPACWSCTVSIAWPAQASFTSRAASKSEAANRASLLTLQWLQGQGKINRKGEVELMVQVNKRVGHQSTVAEIQLGPQSLAVIEAVVNKYYEEVVTHKQEYLKAVEPDPVNKTLSDNNEELDADVDALPLPRGKKINPHFADRRDHELFVRFVSTKQRRQQLSSALPIHQFKHELLELVNNNSVVVVKGEPGCGKSTQVAQYIMEWFTERQAGTDCNVVVTQPRRISAITLADRVAWERGEQVGDVVGYHVRLDARHPRYQDGYILFCSTGLLLRKMITDPVLAGVTHVIVDEAHERNTQLDFLLLLLKRALQLNPSLKVVIMSATINAELFTHYFDDCHSISIPGFTHPVKTHFLDDELKSMMMMRGVKFESEDVERPTVNLEAALTMVHWIHENKPEGAILVFLPGWMEIRTMMERLAAMPDADQLTVFPAHSKLSGEDQRRIFGPPRPGTRKVILSTNIAETSLTINDVVYVVDTATVKEERVELKTGLVCLDNQWASQANIRQRRGRAGRVRPGESYHLLSEAKYNSLGLFPIPEINRTPLTRSALDVKMYTKDENINQFLSCLPEPPSEEAINHAVSVLQGMGALDHDGELTALGKRIYKLPLDPHLSKALVHACLFRCVGPLLTIATLLSADYSLYENTLGLKSRIRLSKQQYSPGSDHLAGARLYHEWESCSWAGEDESRYFCQQHGLLYKGMDRTKKLRGLHGELLNATRLLPLHENINDLTAPSNKFSLYDELVKSVLLSGLGKILISHIPLRKRGLVVRTVDGSPAVISTESVNSKFKELPTPFLTYFKSVSSAERRTIIVHETSLLSAVSVVLFLPAIVTMKNMAGLELGKSIITIQNEKPINIVVNQKEGEQLLHLRQVLWNVLEYLVENEGEPSDQEQYETVCTYRDELLGVLANLTSEQGANIDFTESGELRQEPTYDHNTANNGYSL